MPLYFSTTVTITEKQSASGLVTAERSGSEARHKARKHVVEFIVPPLLMNDPFQGFPLFLENIF